LIYFNFLFFCFLEFYGFIESSTFNIIAYHGENIYIDCRSNTTLQIQSVIWHKNDAYIQPEFNQTTRVIAMPDGVLVISNASNSDAGNYTCRVNLFGKFKGQFKGQFKEKHVVVRIESQTGKFLEV